MRWYFQAAFVPSLPWWDPATADGDMDICALCVPCQLEESVVYRQAADRNIPHMTAEDTCSPADQVSCAYTFPAVAVF